MYIYLSCQHSTPILTYIALVMTSLKCYWEGVNRQVRWPLYSTPSFQICIYISKYHLYKYIRKTNRHHYKTGTSLVMGYTGFGNICVSISVTLQRTNITMLHNSDTKQYCDMGKNLLALNTFINGVCVANIFIVNKKSMKCFERWSI